MTRWSILKQKDDVMSLKLMRGICWAKGDHIPCLAAQVQRCTLLSIKTGGCPETCTYCSQSSSWRKETGLKAEKLMDLEEVYEVRSLD